MAVLLALVGADLQASEPVVAALACLATALLGLACALARREPFSREDTSARAWERMGADDHVLERVGGAMPPSRRGVWRASGASTWHDPLWLWSARGASDRGREAVVPPHPSERRPAAVPLRGAPIRTQAEPEIASVRRYEPGDPIRQVAWHASAHHGRLMSYELRGAEGQAAIILLDAVSGTDSDAIASTAWRLTRELHPHERAIVCDGERSCDARDAARTLAQFEVDTGAASATDCLNEVAALARRLAELGGWRILLVSDVEGGALERALRSSRLGAKSELVRAGRAAEEKVELQGAANPHGYDALPARLASFACCLVCLALALAAAMTLVEPGDWASFLATAFAVSSAAAILPPRRHVVVRAAVGAALCLAAGVLWAEASLQTQTGLSISEYAAAHGLVMASDTGLVGTANAAAAICARGFERLWRQWVPLALSGTDAVFVCILVAGVIAAFVRLLLSSPRTRPLVALLPLVAQAVSSTYIGSETPPAAIYAACACGLALVGLMPRPRPSSTHEKLRARNLVVPALGILCACALGLVLAAPATTLLARSGLGLGFKGGQLLGSSSVNPLVDLSTNLRENSSDAAFTYTTTYDGPIYLRLATLDNFDGDTWRITEGEGVAEALPGSFSDGSALTSSEAEEVGWTAKRISTTVTLRGLSSAFTPAPSNSSYSAEASGTSAGWAWTADGCLRAASGRTSASMGYTVEGIYLAPIGTQAEANRRLTALYGHIGPSGGSNVSEEALASYLTVPGELPQAVSDVIAEANAEGVTGVSSRSAASTYSNGETPADQQAMTWLVGWFEQGGFSYSLNAPDGNGGNNLEVISDFLERRSGYCTHYATSFAVLARLLGVPSRVAIGYSSADRSGSTYTATNQYLHAWCECYIEDIGWVPFDVTPGYAGNSTARNDGTSETEVSATSSSEVDAGTNGTSTQDAADSQQQDITEGDADGPTNGDSGADNEASDEAKPAFDLSALAPAMASAIPALAVTLLAALALLTPSLVRRHRRTRRLTLIRVQQPSAHSAAWEELCDTARDAGITWPASINEPEVAAIIATHLAMEPSGQGRNPGSELAEQAQAFARAACSERYDAQPPAPPEPEATAATLDDLAQVLRPKDHLARLRTRLLPRSVLRSIRRNA